MKAKIIKADSGTTKYLLACIKFSGDEFGDRDYSGEWISCSDLLGHGENVMLTRRNSKHIWGGDKELVNLKEFICKEFDSLKDVEEISPRDWERVVEEKSGKMKTYAIQYEFSGKLGKGIDDYTLEEETEKKAIAKLRRIKSEGIIKIRHIKESI